MPSRRYVQFERKNSRRRQRREVRSDWQQNYRCHTSKEPLGNTSRHTFSPEGPGTNGRCPRQPAGGSSELGATEIPETRNSWTVSSPTATGFPPVVSSRLSTLNGATRPNRTGDLLITNRSAFRWVAIENRSLIRFRATDQRSLGEQVFMRMPASTSMKCWEHFKACCQFDADSGEGER